MSSQPVAQRRLQYRADTRKAILDAAEELLVEGGLETFSMRRLAERCGCTAPTLYHYFRDKTGLVDALLEERLQRLVAELRAVPLGGGALEQVHALCAAFVAFALRNPSHYALLMLNRGTEVPPVPAGEEAQALLGAPLEDLEEAGVIAAEEREALRQALWSLLHGYILLQTHRPDEEWVPQLLEKSLDAMMRGFLGDVEGGAR